MTLLELAQKRRSCYSLGNHIALTPQQITELVEQAVKQTPSAFNSQSARVLILLDEQHQRFWSLIKTALQKIVPPENFAPTEEKITGFSKAVGTLLFYEDWSAVEALQHRFPLYKDYFPTWAYQANGMLEYLIWLALAEQNIGANLQHYNGLIDDELARAFQVHGTWKLIAQMPFGNIIAPPAEKDFLPIDMRVRVCE